MVTNVDAITIFNGRTDKGARRRIFIPTIIRNVSYTEAKGATVANNGVWSDSVQYKVRVPMGAAVQDGREYMHCLNYAKLDDKEAAQYWTIRKEDLLTLGAYDGGGTRLYEDELATYAKERGIDLIKIMEFADGTHGGSLYTRHWRIGGK